MGRKQKFSKAERIRYAIAENRRQRELVSRNTIKPPQPQQEEDTESKADQVAVNEAKGGFFACYLLCSLCPRFKGHTYIGFTVNPHRRIRQHNGEIKCGARRTKSKRPWEMVLCIYGFPTNVSALQFEWAWQHPTESLAVRKAAVSLKSLSGVVGKITLVYTMLTLPPWNSLKLTVNFLSTKYMNTAAGCPSLPKQMEVQFCPMDELPCYIGGQILDDMDDQDDDAENETRNGELGPPTMSLYDLSDYHHSTINAYDDTLKWNDNDAVRQPEELLTMEDNTDESLRLIGENQAEELLSITDDHSSTVSEPDDFLTLPLWQRLNLRANSLSKKYVENSAVSPSLPNQIDVHFPPMDEIQCHMGGPTFYEKDGLDEHAGNGDQNINLGLTDLSLCSVSHYDHISEMATNDLLKRIDNDAMRHPGEFQTDVSVPSRGEHLDKNTGNGTRRRDLEGQNDKSLHSTPDYHHSSVNATDDIGRSADDEAIRPPRKILTVSREDQPDESLSSREHQLEQLATVTGEDYMHPFILVDSPVAKDHRLQFYLIDTPTNTPFSKGSGIKKTLESGQDKDPGGLIRKSSYLELIAPNQLPRTPALANHNQGLSRKSLFASPTVEVIDILTPSSNSMIRCFRKKKRINNWVSQGIIDLTNSPSFSQLKGTAF